jgi:hypothetical protein
MTGLPDPADRPLLSADESRHACGDVMGRSAWYDALNRGDVPGARRVGRRLLVSTAALRQWAGIDAHANGNGVAHELEARRE